MLLILDFKFFSLKYFFVNKVWSITSDRVEGKIGVSPGINLCLKPLIFNVNILDIKILSHFYLLFLVIWSDNLQEVLFDCFADGLWNDEVNKESCKYCVESEDQEDVPFTLAVIKEVQEEHVDDEVCDPSGGGAEGYSRSQEVVWNDLTGDSGDGSRKADWSGEDVEHKEEEECNSIGMLIFLSVKVIGISLISVVSLVHGVR